MPPLEGIEGLAMAALALRIAHQGDGFSIASVPFVTSSAASRPFADRPCKFAGGCLSVGRSAQGSEVVTRVARESSARGFIDAEKVGDDGVSIGLVAVFAAQTRVPPGERSWARGLTPCRSVGDENGQHEGSEEECEHSDLRSAASKAPAISDPLLGRGFSHPLREARIPRAPLSLSAAHLSPTPNQRLCTLCTRQNEKSMRDAGR